MDLQSILGSIFVAQPLMLNGPGFQVFGPEHRAWLAYCAALVVVLTVIYLLLPSTRSAGSPARAPLRHPSRRSSHARAAHMAPNRGGGALGAKGTPADVSPTRRHMLVTLSCVMLGLLVSEDALMVASGTFWIQWWPLHTCNMCEYVSLAFALTPRRSRVADLWAEVMFVLGLPGALMALLFPGWSYCVPTTWPVVCGFNEHALLVAFVVMTLLGGDLRPRLKNAWMGMAFTVAYFAVMYPFNLTFHTNFAFLQTPAANSPLQSWAASWGTPGYLIPYALVFVGVCVGMNLAWELVRHVATRAVRPIAASRSLLD